MLELLSLNDPRSRALAGLRYRFRLIALIRHQVHCLTNIEILAAVTAFALGNILSTITPNMLALVI